MSKVYLLQDGDIQPSDDDEIYAPLTIKLVEYIMDPASAKFRNLKINMNPQYLLIDAGGPTDTVEDLNT
ncbi:MAG: hypothetical protein K0B02_02780 [DPANN group archaeon]|nr:hypothetical protein [DPANN group archaeon]